MSPRTALTFALAVLLFPAGVLAQTSPTEPDATAPAHVSHVEGTVTLEREGRPENSPLNMPLLSGDRLKTLDGRVEILFADGSALHLDSRTTLDIQSDELVRLIDGRMRLAMVGRGLTYRIDSPAGSVRIAQPGEFKLSMLHGDNETQLELAVIRGTAEIFTDQGSTSVRAGERAYASAGLAPSYAYSYNSANFDAFDQWAEARRDTRLGVSAQYLPEDVRPYSTTFDQYGDWRYVQTYGYVWYPRVAATWRPYYYGRWASYPRYGWTWVGVDPFAYPTHHYGRWGFSSGAWFWIPSSHWAPAYVSWAYAPGYVSWCPLGWNNQAVIGINFYSGAYYPWHAWTVVPRPYFGVGYVHAHYVPHVAPHVWHTFTPRYASPVVTGYAVPRSTVPIRTPGTAVPRGAPSTVYTNLAPGASRVPLGGQRVVVGQPRSTVAPDTAFAVPRGTPGDSSRRGVDSSSPTGAEQPPRLPGVAGVQPMRDRNAGDASVQRAMPRDSGMYRTPIPSGAMSGSPMTARPQDAQIAPGRGAVGGAAGMPSYGIAVPRAGSNPGAAGSPPPRSFGPPPGMPQGRTGPPQAPPAPQPGGAGARRGPGSDRGQPGSDRGQPGSDRGQPGSPPGGAGGHSRGGAPSTGQAAPRGRG